VEYRQLRYESISYNIAPPMKDSAPYYAKHHKPDFLGTQDGIQAMASFLKKSSAFTKNGCSPPTPTPPHIADRSLTDFIESKSQISSQHESH